MSVTLQGRTFGQYARTFAFPLVLSALGCYVAAEGLRYGLRGPGGVGAGFMPFVAGCVLTTVSLVDVFQRWRADPGVGEGSGERLSRDGVIALGGLLVGQIAFVALLPHAGFTLSVLLFCSFIVRWVGHTSLLKAVLVGALLTVLFYELFAVALAVPLPMLLDGGPF